MLFHQAQHAAVRDCVWSTDPDQAARPLRDWGEAISGGIAEMDVDSPVAPQFRARWRRYGLGPLDLNFLAASPQRVIRTAAIIARSGDASYDLLYLRRCGARVVQHGKNVEVPRGSFILLDNRAPYDLSFAGESDCLTAHLTDQWLRKWAPRPESLFTQPIDGNSGWGAPLASLLLTINTDGLDTAALPRSMIADQFGGLLALMIGKFDAPDSRHREAMLARINRQIEARFDDAELTPDAVASAVGISKRHLHGLFARSGSSFGATLLAIRLDRAAAMLADRRFGASSIGDIALACGFNDPSHFARRFRDRHQLGPTQYRALHK